MSRTCRGRGRVAVLLAGLAVSVFGCAPRSSARTQAGPRGGEGAEAARGSAPAPGSTDTNSPVWRAAATGEPIDLARLAHRQDAEQLVVVAAEGGPMAETALGALPSAPDALSALGRLCDLTRTAPLERKGAVLRAVRAILSEPPVDAERTDPGYLGRCPSPLRAAAEDASLTATERDLAASALELLEEHRR